MFSRACVFMCARVLMRKSVGVVVCVIATANPDTLLQLPCVRCLLTNLPVPFFAAHFRPRSNSLRGYETH